MVESASRVFTVIAGNCLLGMVALVTLNVISRRIPFLGPIPGTHEIAGYLGALVICLTLAYNQVKQGNIGVEFLVSRFSKRTQAAVESVVWFVSMLLYFVIAWRCVVYALGLRQAEEVSPTLSIPFYPLILIIAFCCALLGLVLFTDFLKATMEAFKK